MEHWKPGDIEWEKAPPGTFTGEVLFGPVRNDGVLNILAVSFSPAARTDWHHHPEGQVLYVTNGAGLVQNAGGAVVEISTGDLVHAPPGEVHWHGALPDSPMTHVSHTTGGATVWEPRKVTDEEYASARNLSVSRSAAQAPQSTIAVSMPRAVKDRLAEQAWTEYKSLTDLVVGALERATEPDSQLGCLTSLPAEDGSITYELVSGWRLPYGWTRAGAFSQQFKISQEAADRIENLARSTRTSRQDVCRALLHDYVRSERPNWDANQLFD